MTTSEDVAVIDTAPGLGSFSRSSVKHGAKLGASTIEGPTSTETPRKLRGAVGATDAPSVRRLCACIWEAAAIGEADEQV